MTAENKRFDIIVVLDESGSMSKMKGEPIQAINTYCKGLVDKSSSGSTYTIVKFNNTVNKMVENSLLKDFICLTESDYKPSNMTALHDAICKTINSNDTKDNVVMLIITDGEENCSVEFKLNDSKKMIKNVEDNHNWKVIFMGANIDTLKEGSSMNISAGRCITYDQNVHGNLTKLCRETSKTVSNYFSCIKGNADLLFDRNGAQSPIPTVP